MAISAFRFVHRTSVTLAELQHNLEEWKSLNAQKYPILYLGYHGNAGKIVLGSKDYFGDSEIDLEKLAEGLGEGTCTNRIVHFGSCSTLDVEEKRISSFIAHTGVSAVSGYAGEVDWTESVAFDMLYIKLMQSGGGRSLTPTVMKSIRDGNASRPGLLEEDGSPYFEWGESLGFRLEVKR